MSSTSLMVTTLVSGVTLCFIRNFKNRFQKIKQVSYISTHNRPFKIFSTTHQIDLRSLCYISAQYLSRRRKMLNPIISSAESTPQASVEKDDGPMDEIFLNESISKRLTANSLNNMIADDLKSGKPDVRLASSPFVYMWAGLPIFANHPRLQNFYDFICLLMLLFVGCTYCLYLVISDGLFTNAMWLFIEAMVMGCWLGFLNGVRWNKGYSDHTKYITSLWTIDFALTTFMVLLYFVVGGVYFGEMRILLSSASKVGYIIEIMHGVTQWTRYGAVAVASLAFCSNALELSFDLRTVRFDLMRIIEEYSKVSREFRMTMQLEGGLTIENEQHSKDLVAKWIATHRKVQDFCSRWRIFFSSIIIFSALAFFAWFVNSLISDRSTPTASSLMAGTVVISFMMITSVSIWIAAFLTKEQIQCAMVTSEFCYQSPAVMKENKWLPSYVTQHLLFKGLGVRIFGFTVDWSFFLSFLSIVFTGAFTIIKFKTRV